MRNKNYKKIIATTATSAFVASALVPAAMAAETTNFTDVNSNYKEAVDYLVNHNITNGMNATEFGTTQNIKRGDAAVFIARALGLNTANAKDQGFKDLNNRVKGAVNAIVQEGIASGKTAESFDPDKNITRQEMAKMLVNAYDLTAEKNAGFTDVNKNWITYVSALKENGITKGKTETTFVPEANLTRGEFALFMYRSETLEESVVTPEITSISALNATTAKVAFNTKMDGLKLADVKVKTKASNVNQVVKTVTLAQDKKSAEVTFYEPLTANETYSVDINNTKVQMKGELVVGSLNVSTINMENQSIPAGVATDILFTLHDEKGADVTAQFKDQIKFVSDATVKNGKITLAKGTSATVKAVFEKAGKVVAESSQVTIKAEANPPAKLSNWTVATEAPTFDDKFKQNTIVYANENATLYTEVVDQFGKKLNNPSITFESMTPNVAVVDEATGAIQVLGSGNASVKITVKDGDKVAFVETVKFEVRDVPAVNTLTLSKTSLNLSIADTGGMNIEATVLDQFGNPIKDQAVTVTEKSPANAQPILDIKNTDAKTNNNGVMSFKIASAANATIGNRVVEVKVGQGKSAVTATLTVDVKKPGVFTKYDVRGLKTVLDKNAEAKADSMEISVLSVDANGLMIKSETPDVKITDSKGAEPLAGTVEFKDNAIVLGSNAVAGESYTVYVEVDGKPITTHVFTVVDTTPAAVDPSILFTSSTVNVEANETLLDAITKITQLKDGNGYKVAGVKGATANSKVVSISEDGTLEKETFGSTKVYVQSIVLKKADQSDKVLVLKPVEELVVNVK